MGCASSKLDDLPAVVLCKERCGFLDEAIRLRYSLSEAHFSYVQSLKGVSGSLRGFLEQDFGGSVSPELHIPAKRKGQSGDGVSEGAVGKGEVVRHSHSSSGSHLHFHSDSEDEEDGGSLHHSDGSLPLHGHGGHIEFMDQDMGSSGGFMQMNYMKNKATPSVLYEQRPINAEIGHMGESSSYPYYASNNLNPNLDPYYEYSNYGSGTALGGFYGGVVPNYGNSSPPLAVASSSRPAPPPPRSSGWDFLNPFESYDRYYAPYTPNHNAKEVREEEGIPDLEDEEYQHEVVKEVHEALKSVDLGGGYPKTVMDDDRKSDVREASSDYNTRPSGVSVDNEGPEYNMHVVEKKIIDDEDKPVDRTNVAAFKSPREASEVAREIEVQFQRASESGIELVKILEVGKLPYSRKHVSSMVSSQPSTSKSAKPSTSTDKEGVASFSTDEDVALRSRNLSSTLQKLYLWEKKLYNEVKAEEKMRVLLDKKCQKLKRLDQRGAEAHKVDSTRALIKSLSSKIRIAIDIVDKISVTINKIRDEELWPQLNELIQRLCKMWTCMLECHRSQCQAIREARALSFGKLPGDAHNEDTMQLEHELINWTSIFSTWIITQKGYIRAINNWLMKSLLYEPEETPDGIVPFSPGRMGAPTIFVICNRWSQALDRISEHEVVDSMRVFTVSVFQLCEQDKLEMRQRMMANKDLERKIKILDKEDQKIQKQIQALEKKIVLTTSNGTTVPVPVYQSDTSRSSNLQASLLHIFEAMERFTADMVKAYEELLQHCEEETNAQPPASVS